MDTRAQPALRRRVEQRRYRMIPYALLCVFLLLVGAREKLLAPRRRA